MKILGVDYGRRKLGLATATTQLAEVYGVIRTISTEEAIKKLKRIVEKEDISKIVVGVSEGKMAEETKSFAKSLEVELQIPIALQDETLSTRTAQELSKEAKLKRKKRKELEDAFAATLILQDYLDSHSS